VVDWICFKETLNLLLDLSLKELIRIILPLELLNHFLSKGLRWLFWRILWFWIIMMFYDWNITIFTSGQALIWPFAWVAFAILAVFFVC